MELLKVYYGSLYLTCVGELILFDLIVNEIDSRRKVASNEIVDILANNELGKAVVAALDSKVYIWDFSRGL